MFNNEKMKEKNASNLRVSFNNEYYIVQSDRG